MLIALITNGSTMIMTWVKVASISKSFIDGTFRLQCRLKFLFRFRFLNNNKDYFFMNSGVTMAKITFDSELTNHLKGLRKELIGSEMSDEFMVLVHGGDEGCGAYCQVTCSYWCKPIGSGQTDNQEPPE
jgi:hypothetical protein